MGDNSVQFRRKKESMEPEHPPISFISPRLFARLGIELHDGQPHPHDPKNQIPK